MLFDKIPGLIGSGVIPRRFQDILGALKTMILETFFEERFLRAYISERSAGFFEGLDLKGKLEKAMRAEGFDGALARCAPAFLGRRRTLWAPLVESVEGVSRFVASSRRSRRRQRA
jgi:hypothetical protein